MKETKLSSINLSTMTASSLVAGIPALRDSRRTTMIIEQDRIASTITSLGLVSTAQKHAAVPVLVARVPRWPFEGQLVCSL